MLSNAAKGQSNVVVLTIRLGAQVLQRLQRAAERPSMNLDGALGELTYSTAQPASLLALARYLG